MHSSWHHEKDRTLVGSCDSLEDSRPATFFTLIKLSVHGSQIFTRLRGFWLGLVPRQCSSGGKSRLLGISKRRDRYMRTLLIHGARAVVVRAGAKSDARSRWIAEKRRQRGTNRACVAVANKNARIIWTLLAHDTSYQQAA